MAGQIHKRARPKRDLVEQYLYLAGNAGIEMAERFLQGFGAEVGESCLQLMLLDS